jgi:hypothetical protein
MALLGPQRAPPNKEENMFEKPDKNVDAPYLQNKGPASNKSKPKLTLVMTKRSGHMLLDPPIRNQKCYVNTFFITPI